MRMKEAPVELQYAPQPDPAWNSNNKMAGEVYGWQSRFFSSAQELFSRCNVEAKARRRSPWRRPWPPRFDHRKTIEVPNFWIHILLGLSSGGPTAKPVERETELEWTIFAATPAAHWPLCFVISGCAREPISSYWLPLWQPLPVP
jgi:hypothetical protein